MADKAGSKPAAVCGCLKSIFDPESRRKAALDKYQENYRKSMAEQHHSAYQSSQQAASGTGVATPFSSNVALDTIKEESSSHSKTRSTNHAPDHSKSLTAESRSSLLGNST